LFPYLVSILKQIHAPVVDAEIEARMVASECGDVILEEDDGDYEKGDSFKSYHYQARQPLSHPTMLVSFLSIWMKGAWSLIFLVMGSPLWSFSQQSNCFMDMHFDCFSQWCATPSMDFEC